MYSRRTEQPTLRKLKTIPPPWSELKAEGQRYYEQFCKAILAKQELDEGCISELTRAARFFQMYKEEQESLGTRTKPTRRMIFAKNYLTRLEQQSGIKGLMSLDMEEIKKREEPDRGATSRGMPVKSLSQSS